MPPLVTIFLVCVLLSGGLTSPENQADPIRKELIERLNSITKSLEHENQSNKRSEGPDEEENLTKATDSISKLVYSTIAQRVKEAEVDLSKALLASLDKRIYEATSALKSNESTASECKDTLSDCEQLQKSGVCESSRQAMQSDCKKTCGLCNASELTVEKSEQKVKNEQKMKVENKAKSVRNHRHGNRDGGEDEDQPKPKPHKPKKHGKTKQQKKHLVRRGATRKTRSAANKEHKTPLKSHNAVSKDHKIPGKSRRSSGKSNKVVGKSHRAVGKSHRAVVKTHEVVGKSHAKPKTHKTGTAAHKTRHIKKEKKTSRQNKEKVNNLCPPVCRVSCLSKCPQECCATPPKKAARPKQRRPQGGYCPSTCSNSGPCGPECDGMCCFNQFVGEMMKPSSVNPQLFPPDSSPLVTPGAPGYVAVVQPVAQVTTILPGFTGSCGAFCTQACYPSCSDECCAGPGLQPNTDNGLSFSATGTNMFAFNGNNNNNGASANQFVTENSDGVGVNPFVTENVNGAYYNPSSGNGKFNETNVGFGQQVYESQLDDAGDWKTGDEKDSAEVTPPSQYVSPYEQQTTATTAASKIYQDSPDSMPASSCPSECLFECRDECPEICCRGGSAEQQESPKFEDLRSTQDQVCDPDCATHCTPSCIFNNCCDD